MLQNFVCEICSHMLGVGIGCLKVGWGYTVTVVWVGCKIPLLQTIKPFYGQGSIPLRENVNWLMWLIIMINFLGF
jgi:hypothetical protein